MCMYACYVCMSAHKTSSQHKVYTHTHTHTYIYIYMHACMNENHENSKYTCIHKHASTHANSAHPAQIKPGRALRGTIPASGINTRPGAQIRHILPMPTHTRHALLCILYPVPVARIDHILTSAVLTFHALRRIINRTSVTYTAHVLTRSTATRARRTRRCVISRSPVAFAVYVVPHVAFFLAWYTCSSVSASCTGAWL
jgi:hypothetical protein